MGWGDDIMSTAYAREAVKYAKAEHKQDALVAFGQHDPIKNVIKNYWSLAFENNPHIVDSQPDAPKYKGALITIKDYPGARLYVDYEKCEMITKENGEVWIKRFAYDPDFRAPRGELFFSNAERNDVAWADTGRSIAGSIVLEPNVKEGYGAGNKAWPAERWHELVEKLAGPSNTQLVQFVWGGEISLDPDLVRLVRTATPRHAAYLMRRIGLFVGTDGGLHHTAAALGLPAVVLWGHYSSPKLLGYDDHTNLRVADGGGCGTIGVSCSDCVAAMEAISVGQVFRTITDELDTARELREGKEI